MMTSGTEKRPLPDSWTWTQLGQVCTVNGGYAFKSRDYQEEGIPLLRISNINDKNVTFDEKTVYLSKSFASELSDFLLNSGDIVIALSGATTGKYGVYNFPGQALLNQRVGRLKFDDLSTITSKYIFYYMEVIRKDILEEAYGAAQPNISTRKLAEFDVPLAPLPEQERIVAEIEKQFTRLDQAVASLRRLQSNLARYKASVLKAACDGRLVPQDPADEPADQLLERILAERRAQWQAANPGKKYQEPVGVEEDTAVLPDLPEGWVWTSIEQIMDVATGATPKRGNSKYWDNGTIPWITSGVVNELFVDEADEFISEQAIRETNTKVFPQGTLLVAMYGEGKTRGKVTEMRLNAATNQALAALLFTGISNDCKPYIKLFLEKNYEDIRRLSSGGVQPNLNLSIIRSTKFPLPPLAEQERIVAEVERRLSVVTATEQTITANLSRAERLRQSILHRAFTGQLVPSHL